MPILRPASQGRNLGIRVLSQLQNTLKGLFTAFSSFNHRLQEKPHPVPDIIGLSYPSQCIVISPSMLLQMSRQIQGWLGQQTVTHQIQWNEKTPDTPVTI